MYIHTTYLDLLSAVPNALPSNIVAAYEKKKKTDPKTYNHIILGGWLRELEGTLFTGLKKFKLSELNIELVEHRIGCIDVADRGTDFLCMPIAYVIGRFFYIVDVVITQKPSRISKPLCIGASKKHELDVIWVESNNGGAMYGDDLEDKLPATAIVQFHSSANKESRILATSWFVNDFCFFRSDYEAGSPYDIFMEFVESYNTDPKLNQYDDANDGLAGLVKHGYKYLKHNYTEEETAIYEG